MDLTEFMKLQSVRDERTFGKFVRQRRNELGVSLRDFAAQLGMTAAYLSDIEKGNRNPPVKFAGKMRGLLRISEEEYAAFDDLVYSSRDSSFRDLKPYFESSSMARAAMRKARDVNLSDEKWAEIIRSMD